MIDALMVLWNRDRGKKLLKMFFTFVLICMSLFLLLLVVTTVSAPSFSTMPRVRNTPVNFIAPTTPVTMQPGRTVWQNTSRAVKATPTPIQSADRPCIVTASPTIANIARPKSHMHHKHATKHHVWKKSRKHRHTTKHHGLLPGQTPVAMAMRGTSSDMPPGTLTPSPALTGSATPTETGITRPQIPQVSPTETDDSVWATAVTSKDTPETAVPLQVTATAIQHGTPVADGTATPPEGVLVAGGTATRYSTATPPAGGYAITSRHQVLHQRHHKKKYHIPGKHVLRVHVSNNTKLYRSVVVSRCLNTIVTIPSHDDGVPTLVQGSVLVLGAAMLCSLLLYSILAFVKRMLCVKYAC